MSIKLDLFCLVNGAMCLVNRTREESHIYGNYLLNEKQSLELPKVGMPKLVRLPQMQNIK